MSYVTLQQLIDRYGESTLVAATDRGELALGVIDQAVVARAIADTDAVIDGYLASRYALPLTAAQPLLADLAGAIVAWKIHTFEPDPKIKADYEAAIRSLREISSGAIRLSAAGIEAVGTGSSGARVTDRERPFTAENMRGFI